MVEWRAFVSRPMYVSHSQPPQIFTKLILKQQWNWWWSQDCGIFFDQVLDLNLTGGSSGLLSLFRDKMQCRCQNGIVHCLLNMLSIRTLLSNLVLTKYDHKYMVECVFWYAFFVSSLPWFETHLIRFFLVLNITVTFLHCLYADVEGQLYLLGLSLSLIWTCCRSDFVKHLSPNIHIQIPHTSLNILP